MTFSLHHNYSTENPDIDGQGDKGHINTREGGTV